MMQLPQSLSTSDSLKWLVLACGVAYGVTICVICVYRLTWHPLAKYPGPFLAKLTNGYAAYHALVGDLHLDMCKAHATYGPTVRYGPNRILVNTAKGLHDIYGYGKNIKKSKGYLPILPTPGAWSVHTSIDKAMHGHKRRVISQGLSDDCIKAFEPAFLVHLRRFMSKIAPEATEADDGGWSKPINMTPTCNHFTFDVMGEFGFGKAFGLQDGPENRFIIKAIAASNVRTSIYCQFPQLAALKLERILYPRGSEMRQKFLKVTREFAEERTTQEKDSKSDLFRFVVDAKDPESGKGFSMTELWAESKFLIVAGSDTSSTVLATSFFYLARYPEVKEKLYREVHSTFSSLEDICMGSKLMSCTYLRACVDETMRMNPPAGGAMWREVDKGGAFVNDVYVDEGFDVGTSMYAVHHNEDYYLRSYDFRPERWIKSDEFSAEAVEAARKCLNPFSLGPRGCIGRALALMEIRLTLARVVWEYDLKKPDGPLGKVGEGNPSARNGRHRVNEFQLIDHLTSEKDGPYIQFKRR